jgi:hypothetical protein
LMRREGGYMTREGVEEEITDVEGQNTFTMWAYPMQEDQACGWHSGPRAMRHLW